MNILIIDDEPIIRRALERAFRSKGHSVEMADGGVSGIEKWRMGEPDVVMIDVLMPDLNGPQVIEKVGAKAQNSYVVLMSAFTGDFDAQKAKNYGAHDFFSKPFDDVFAIVKSVEEQIFE